jgi:hypothetical protein
VTGGFHHSDVNPASTEFIVLPKKSLRLRVVVNKL